MNRSMSLDNMSFTEALSKAVNAVIRPPRAEYDEDQISFIVYDMHSPPIPRIPLAFPNRRGERLVGSLYQSITFDTEKIHRCIIYLHGNIGSQKEGRFIVPFYAPHGISVYCFDFSGSGNSGGKYITLGKNESTDVIDVIRFLSDEMDFQEFILWGRSMGAACAIMATALLTREVDQHYNKLHQHKLQSNSFSLASPNVNSLNNFQSNNFYQSQKHANSFSLKRDNFVNQTSNESSNSILSNSDTIKEKNEPPTNPLFQSTPTLQKSNNLLLTDSQNPSSINDPIISNQSPICTNSKTCQTVESNKNVIPQSKELNENSKKENEENDKMSDINIQNDQLRLNSGEKIGINEENANLNSESKQVHLIIDNNQIHKGEADDSIPDELKPVPKAQRKIRKAKSQIEIEGKEKICKDKSDDALHKNVIPHLYKPKTRASLPPMVKPLLPSLFPPTPQVPIQDLIIQQNRSPHQTPLYKPNVPHQDSTQSQSQFHIQASKPIHPQQNKPKMPKPPKPPQHGLHENNNNNDNDNLKQNVKVGDKKHTISDFFSDTDDSSKEKKKKSLRIPIKGIIVDSAYSSLEDMLNAISAHVNLGSISSFVAQWYIKRSVYDQVGLTCKDVQPSESAKLCWRVPMLLGHSPEDDFIPFSQAQKIFNSYAGPKELVILTGGHNSERNEKWINLCTRFIATYFGIELETLKQKVTSQRPEHAASFINLIQNSQH